MYQKMITKFQKLTFLGHVVGKGGGQGWDKDVMSKTLALCAAYKRHQKAQ